MPEDLQAFAYEDSPLPTEAGQTISTSSSSAFWLTDWLTTVRSQFALTAPSLSLDAVGQNAGLASSWGRAAPPRWPPWRCVQRRYSLCESASVRPTSRWREPRRFVMA